MAIVLDTGVLYHPEVLRRLAELPDDIVLPAIAYAERGRQILRDGRSLPELDVALAENEIRVEPFDRDAALRYAVHVHDDATWRRTARDALIAGHVGENDILWTTNRSDFEVIGVPADQIVEVG